MQRFEQGFITDVAASAIEAVDVFLPGVFDEVHLELARADDWVQFKSADGTLKAPHPKALDAVRSRLHVPSWPAVITAAFTRLDEELQRAGVSWEPGKARIVRDAKSATLVLGDVAELRVPHATWDARVFTEALGEAMARHMPAAIQRQEQLARELSDMKRWDYEGSRGEVTFAMPSGPLRERVQAIGSYASDLSWLWAWSNRSFAPEMSSGVAGLERRAREEGGLGVLRRPGFYCDDQFAMLIGLLAGALLGARAVFPARTQGSTVFFALMGPFN